MGVWFAKKATGIGPDRPGGRVLGACASARLHGAGRCRGDAGVAIAAGAASAPARRPGVLAMLMAGSYWGTVLGFAVSGVLAQHLGWRVALMCMGAPGVVLGALAWLTLSEPEEPKPAQTLPRVWLSDWLPVVRTARFIDATMAVASGEILGWAAFAWLLSFYQRSYGMTPSEIGFWLAGAVGVGAAVGALAGGVLATRLSVRWPGAAMWLSFWTTLASAPLLTAAFMTDSKALSLLCVQLSGVTGAVCMGPDCRHRAGIGGPPQARHAGRAVWHREHAARPGGRAAAGRRGE